MLRSTTKFTSRTRPLPMVIVFCILCKTSVLALINVRLKGSPSHTTTHHHSSTAVSLLLNVTPSPSVAHLITHPPQDNSLQARDILSAEERERKELEWLVNTTSEILFSTSTNASRSKASRRPMSQSRRRRIHNLMKAWSARRTLGAPHVIDQLFDVLQANHALNIHAYNIKIQAWATSNDLGAVQHCMETLRVLKEHEGLQPNVHSYNACIKAWIRTKTAHGLEQAEQLLQELQTQYNETGYFMLSPNRRTFNFLLYGLAHSNKTSEAAHRALEIFEFMKTQKEEFHQPNSNTFHQVFLCLVRNHDVEGFEDSLEETYETCLVFAKDNELEFTADAFNVYMSGWLKSKRPESLERIESALSTMERMREEGSLVSTPNCATMNIVLAAYVRFGGLDAVDMILHTRKCLQSLYSISPNTVTFNTVIDAHCKSRRAIADVAVSSLLQIMEKNLIKGNKFARPDSYSYCAAIDCIAKNYRSNAGAQAEQILRRMIELHQKYGGAKPSIVVYNAVLNAMAASSPVNMTSVKTLMSELEDKKASTPKPTIVTYNSALKAALRSGTVHGAEWADELLQSLEVVPVNTKNRLKPDSFSYTTVIAAYGRSSYPDKATKALELVERSIQMYHDGKLDGSPGTTIFNAACNACCFAEGDTDEKSRAFSNAITISNLLRKHAKPDEVTYGTLLRACSQLLPPNQPRQQTAVRQIFRRLCEDGLCGGFVKQQMGFAASSDTYAELLGFEKGEDISNDKIPEEWRRKVKSTGS